VPKHQGHSVAGTVSRRSLTANAQVLSQSNPRGVCGVNIDDVGTHSSEFFGFHLLVSFYQRLIHSSPKLHTKFIT